MDIVTKKAKLQEDLLFITKEEYESVDPQNDQDEDEDKIANECGLDTEDDNFLLDDIDNEEFVPLPYEEDDEEFTLTASNLDNNEKTFVKKSAKKIAPPIANTNINYAPKMEPVEGVFELCVVGLKWNDHKAQDLGDLKALANGIAKTYAKLSDGKLQFKVTVKIVDTGLNFAKKNLNKAEKIAIAVVSKAKKTGKYDYFAICRGMGTPHAGTNILHLKGTLLRDGLHEMGHVLKTTNKQRKIPSKLGHSGVIEMRVCKPHLVSSGDAGSFMGRYASATIAGPQFYYEGWLDVMQVAAHDPASTNIYKLGPVSAKDGTADCLRGVLIPREKNRRDQFLSVAPIKGKQILNFYYSTGGGSQKIASFNEKPFVAEDIIIEQLERDDNILTVQIRPNPEFDGTIDDIEMTVDEGENDEFEEVDDEETVVNNKPRSKPKHKPRNK